jgi:outer membrane protein TolC
MKRLISTLLALMMLFGAHSQQSQPYTTASFNPNVDSLAEGLVALAMNNPSIRYDENLAGQFNYIYKKSKTAWLNAIVIQGNLNEYSISESAADRASNLFPRYNFGVQVPLGLFINDAKQTKSDLYKAQAMSTQVEVERRNIRKEVLIAYHDYLMNKHLFALEQQVINDWHIIYVKAEQKFTKGEITLESFYSTTRIYNDELNKEVTLTAAIQDTESTLEALIGMNLGDAIQMINDHKNTNQ